ncbi:MAG: hypothetical protein A3J60_00405 [Candidatus Pacebacteria bacterium RIFCSPHIGHO2_02_FULL_46_9]|nr:MAG: hypothetical protein A3J60_00405 [Candidatus Pacebacteria bacterium RIFCSPHIGHO2_02_FULL_46_9]
MIPRIIYLIRHGQKHLHAGNPGLTEIGARQAKETVEMFEKPSKGQAVGSKLWKSMIYPEMTGLMLTRIAR